MSKKFSFTKLLLIVSTLFFSTMGHSLASSFTRTLKTGSTGDDVLLLQQLLNKDSRTMIARSGAGSPGNETRTFGGLTKAAVIRFQELYADEILKPVGLLYGTGFVGQSTLKKLEMLAQGVPKESGIAITSLLPSRTSPSTFVTARGVGFSEKSVVVFAGVAIPSQLIAPDALQFLVPAGVGEGFQQVTVRDEQGGLSNMLEIKITGAVATTGNTLPVVTRLSPLQGGLGTTITITGSGFATTPTNTIYTGYSKISGVASSDGKTLSFTIPSYLPQFDFSQADFSGLDGEATLPFGIAVENTNGMSEYSLFTFVVH